jgi:hypothetical protein
MILLQFSFLEETNAGSMIFLSLKRGLKGKGHN